MVGVQGTRYRYPEMSVSTTILDKHVQRSSEQNIHKKSRNRSAPSRDKCATGKEIACHDIAFCHACKASERVPNPTKPSVRHSFTAFPFILGNHVNRSCNKTSLFIV